MLKGTKGRKGDSLVIDLNTWVTVSDGMHGDVAGRIEVCGSLLCHWTLKGLQSRQPGMSVEFKGEVRLYIGTGASIFLSHLGLGILLKLLWVR